MLENALLLVAFVAGGHSLQRPRATGVFTYNPGEAPSISRLGVQEKLPPGGTRPAPIIGQKGAQKPTQGPSYVSISGNFGGVFYVSGVGVGTSQTQSNLIAIVTNRSLTFTPTAFKPVVSTQGATTDVGSIAYSMAIYSGTPTQIGSLVAGPVAGTDAGFNGQSLSVTVPEQQGNENFVLVLTRTLSVSSSAVGQNTLIGTGSISVAIN